MIFYPTADAIAFFENNKHANANVSLNSSDCSFPPLRSMVEQLVQDPVVAGSTFYSAGDELEPLDMIQINLEASLLALAGKLQVHLFSSIRLMKFFHAFLLPNLEPSGFEREEPGFLLPL